MILPFIYSPYFVIIEQFCLNGSFFLSACSVCVSLHPNTFMLLGCWCDGYFFTLCHSPHSGATTEQCVCVCVDPAGLLPASLLNKCRRPGWPSGMRLPHPPPLLFFFTELNFSLSPIKSLQHVSTELVSDLLRLPLMWKLRAEDVATFTYSLVLQAEQLPICRNTHILLLFEQKPNPEVGANVNASRSCAFSKCRGRNWFMAPVVVK